MRLRGCGGTLERGHSEIVPFVQSQGIQRVALYACTLVVGRTLAQVLLTDTAPPETEATLISPPENILVKARPP